MKKWLSLFLAMILLVTASFALAENAGDELPPDAEAGSGETEQTRFYSSLVPFGEDPKTAPESYKTHLNNFNFTDEPTVEIKTLPDGTEYMVQTFVTKEGEANQMTGMLFYVNNMVVAGVEDLTLPEGSTDSGMETKFREFFGGPKQFNIQDIGSIADMIGEAAHLDAVKGVWQYKNQILLSGANVPVDINAFITIVNIDGHTYMAEWFGQASQSASAAQQNLQGLKGYSELTEEERIAVNMYSDYLEQKKMEQLQPYVDFLLSKHKQN